MRRDPWLHRRQQDQVGPGQLANPDEDEDLLQDRGLTRIKVDDGFLAIRQILDEQPTLRINNTKPICQMDISDDRKQIRAHVARFYGAAREKGIDTSRIKPQYQKQGAPTRPFVFTIKEAK